MVGVPSEGQLRGESPRKLTKRENEVLVLLAEGMTNKGIASKLQMAEGTVKIYVSRILMKTNKNNRTELALMFINQEYGVEGKQGAD